MANEHPEPELLEAIGAFRDLPKDLLVRLAGRMTVSVIAPGEALMRQGEPGDCLFVIQEGRARGFVSGASDVRDKLAEFGHGEIVGEMALVTGEPRTADVIAVDAVRAVRLAKADFTDLAFQYPDLGMILTTVVSSRLGQRSLDGLGGKQVGEYCIRRSLGRGGMAVVYEAAHVETGALVALKMMSYRLLYERGAMARFQREAEIVGRLEHEHIVRIHEVFSAYRTQFIAMELLTGPDLGKVMRASGPFSEARLRPLIGQLAQALRYMHGESVVHRDLKPGNVLIHQGATAKLSDFGLARAPYALGESALTEGHLVLGTPLYMSPEQTSGEDALPASDVYALGCIAYEALTGSPPCGGNSYGELFQAKRNFVIAPAEQLGISTEFHDVLRHALDPAPERRAVDLEALSRWAAPFE